VALVVDSPVTSRHLFEATPRNILPVLVLLLVLLIVPVLVLVSVLVLVPGERTKVVKEYGAMVTLEAEPDAEVIFVLFFP
jgi:hypothetical protein